MAPKVDGTFQIEVTVAGLEGSGPVECSRGVRIVPDVALSSVDFDVRAADPS